MTAHLLHELKVMFGLSENRNDGKWRREKMRDLSNARDTSFFYKLLMW